MAEISVRSCRACDDNRAADRGEDDWAVAELSTGYVRLNPTQYHRGATFFVSRSCVAELHHLAGEEQAAHLTKMVAVARAVFAAFGPRKLNYEALGNSVPHLHWWITPPVPRGLPRTSTKSRREPSDNSPNP